jgi:hypothetical protein
MRTTTAAILAAATLLLGLTGCSSDAKPAPTKTVTVTPTPALSKAEITEQCAAAVAVVIDQRPEDFDPELDEDPHPAECDGLDDSEYLDAYMDGLHRSSEAARERLLG